jgi:Flp pilus assembly pilin Flp
MLRDISRRVAAFLKDDDGLTSFEYGIAVALIIVGLILFIQSVGTSTNNALMRDANDLVAQPSGS